MPYTHARLRNTLAVVRIATGLLFLDASWYKVTSVQYARVDFTQFVWMAMHGGGFAFYGKFLEAFVWPYSTKVAVLVGFTELFIGVGLVLGLAVRPVCALGMVYMLNLMAATWYQPALGEPMWNFPDEQLRYAVPFLLFVLMFIGRAGENWGLGTLYHRRRHKRWEKQWEIKMASELPPPQPQGQAQGKDV
jgi:uncharacterized membrane protein YphA (DoxX/SURF4 family)